jgi:ATP-dependent exoDNAse (exonuclease V) beta subunit
VGPTDLVDEGVRSRIASDLTSRLIVDAAAGSGKTTLVIERIVSLVAVEGLPMSSIAAITFTEAAAAELRLRIRTTLSQRAQSDDRLSSAASEVDDAAICTIHSFALSILAEHWLEAGLPPNVDVLDSANEYLDHKTRWQSFTTGLLEDPEAKVTMIRGLAAGLRLSQLSEIGHEMADHHDRLTPNILATLANDRRHASNPSVDVEKMVGHLERAVAHVHECSDAADKLHQHLLTTVTDALRRVGPLVGSGDEGGVISVLGDLKSLGASKTGQQGNWPDISEVRDACNAAEQARVETLTAVRTSVVADLAWRIAEWAVQGAVERRAEGRFTFHDLLVESCRLVESNASVRRAVRERYRCLLIDEFQDTDPLQARLAHLLGDADGTGPEVARLFVVGDPEQSIYRFRRADVAQFEAAAAHMDERLELTSNFRSVPAILSFVDAVFAGLSAAGKGPDADAHRSLSPVRQASDRPSDGPAVAVLGGPHAEGLARDVRVESTAEVATVVRSIVENAWSVEDENGLHGAKYREIAVLLPTRTALPVLERAFDAADIPYRLEGAALVWGSQDVRDLLAIARAVNDPADPVAVVGALRTPALACGDDDLVRYYRNGGSWDPRASTPDGSPPGDPVASAMRALASLHDRRMWMEPSALISLILTELHFFELALVHRRPRDHWHRLRWVLDQVRAFDEGKEGTLGDFLDWVDLSEEAERWTSSPGPPETDDDAVRVMTVHGAKGLEFPVVVLTGLDSPPSNLPSSLLFDPHGVPRFRFTVDFRSPSHEALGSIEKGLDRAERFRLLYVALTRARDHLVIDLNHKEKSTDAMAAILHPVCESIAGLDRLEPAVASRTPPQPAPFGHPPASDWWAEQDRWAHERKELLDHLTRQPAWSATALSKKAASGLDAPIETTHSRAATERIAMPDGLDTQQRIGRAVHDALSKIDFPTSGELTDEDRGIVAAAARSQRLSDAGSGLVLALVRGAIGSALIRSIARRRHWKELALGAPLPPGPERAEDHPVLEGFADLVSETDAGLLVVDFKTAPGRSSSAQYLLQVASYAYALQAATGRSVDRVVVSYLAPDGTTEESLEGERLESAIAEVLGAA